MPLSLTTLTSSQILNLRTTPVEVLPTPGANLYNIPILILLRSRAGSNAYLNLAANLTLTMNGVNIMTTPMNSNILGTSFDSTGYYTPSNSISPLNVSNLTNQAMFISNTGLLNFAGGNGTLEVWIIYETINA